MHTIEQAKQHTLLTGEKTEGKTKSASYKFRRSGNEFKEEIYSFLTNSKTLFIYNRSKD